MTSLQSLDDLAKRQRLEQEGSRALTKARVSLIRGDDATAAFFASLTMRLQPVVDFDIDTACTNGKELRYNPEFILGLDPKERVGVLVHEVLHCSNKHHTRRLHREPELWNIAADLAVNHIVTEAGFKLPKCGVFAGQGEYKDMPVGKSAEWYYRELQKKQQPEDQQPGGEPGGSGDGDGDDVDGDGNPDPGGTGGVQDAAKDDAGRERSDGDWDVAVQQAENQAKGRGELPGCLSDNVEQNAPSQVDWKAVLRRFCQQLAKDDYSWSRPNRRYVAQGLYLPSLHSEKIGTIVLAVDCSGSCWSKEVLEAFAGELEGVLEVLPSRLLILYHDTQVQGDVEEFNRDDPLVLTPRGGGGTSHRPVFDWIEKHEPDAAAVICLTDLETCFPQPPAIPVLWCSTEDHEAPFGEVLKIEV